MCPAPCARRAHFFTLRASLFTILTPPALRVRWPAIPAHPRHPHQPRRGAHRASVPRSGLSWRFRQLQRAVCSAAPKAPLCKGPARERRQRRKKRPKRLGSHLPWRAATRAGKASGNPELAWRTADWGIVDPSGAEPLRSVRLSQSRWESWVGGRAMPAPTVDAFGEGASNTSASGRPCRPPLH